MNYDRWYIILIYYHGDGKRMDLFGPRWLKSDYTNWCLLDWCSYVKGETTLTLWFHSPLFPSFLLVGLLVLPAFAFQVPELAMELNQVIQVVFRIITCLCSFQKSMFFTLSLYHVFVFWFCPWPQACTQDSQKPQSWNQSLRNIFYRWVFHRIKGKSNKNHPTTSN